MRLPSTALPPASMTTPEPPFPERTLPAPAAVPAEAGGGAGRRAAHGVGRGAGDDGHALVGVGEHGGAGDVGADPVAQHHVAAGALALKEHGGAAIPREDVGGATRRTTDRV